MNQLPKRVVKVGGSLFDMPDLGARIQAWIDSEPLAFNILIAGGGRLIDEIRILATDERTAHWLCIERLNDTARLLGNLIPSFPMSDSLTQLDQSKSIGVILLPALWLREIEPKFPGTRLVETSDVTSDSIAARIAITQHASEMVLFKSADPPSANLHHLADAGFIDSFFPNLASELPPLRIINLRKTSDL